MKFATQRKVMNTAHQIKSYFASFADALRAAWAITKLFFGQSVNLTFAKATGEVRHADAIAVGSLSTLEKGFFRFVETIDGGTQWRSCKLERMIF